MRRFEKGLKELANAGLDELVDRSYLEQLIASCGLLPGSDASRPWHPYPPALHEYKTQDGLRTCQLPCQFAPYLIWLADKGIRRYMEIGVLHGGSFIFAVTYLNRFTPLAFAEAVDINFSECRINNGDWSAPCPVCSTKLNTTSEAFARHLDGHDYDYVLIDGDHSYSGVKNDFGVVNAACVPLIGFHDICAEWQPGVVKCWGEDYAGFTKHEWVEQYPRGDDFTVMGLGVLERT